MVAGHARKLGCLEAPCQMVCPLFWRFRVSLLRAMQSRVNTTRCECPRSGGERPSCFVSVSPPLC
jgi:hypothetical protein